MDRRQLGEQLFGRLKELRGQVLERTGFRVLTYRRFWPPTPETRKLFEAQLDHLRENYVVRSLNEVVQELRAGRLPVRGTMCITVDGGHRDFYNVAYPALRARALSATLFLPTGFVDGGRWLWFDRIVHAIRHSQAKGCSLVLPDASPDGEVQVFSLESPAEKRAAAGQIMQILQELPVAYSEAIMLDIFDQLRVAMPDEPTEEFAALTWEDCSDMWPNNISFGSQGVNGKALTALPDQFAIRAELTASKERIAEKLGDYDILLSYPGGAFDASLAEDVRHCGFRGAVTSTPIRNVPPRNGADADLFRILRIPVEPGIDPMEFAKLCAVTRK